jgi:signal transduction histidine kinase
VWFSSSRSLGASARSAIRLAPSRRCGFPADRIRQFCDDDTVIRSETDRLRTLLDTGIAISSELSLDTVLERIVEAASSLTGARYAALGVIDRTGLGLERFITTGIDNETRTVIGDPPHGRGILGVLIRDAKPLRLHDLTEDPRSVGFPPGHPPMRSFLGVPILVRGVSWGNLYLTEKDADVDFSHADEELVSLLAAQAAVAIENARLYESATAWSRQLESLNEIGNALVSELDLGRLLDLIAGRLRELINARDVGIALNVGDELRIEAASGERMVPLRGSTLPLAGSKAGRVLERRRSERIDSLLEDPEVDHSFTRALGARSGLWVPLFVRNEPIGVLIAHDKLGPDVRFGDGDVRVAEQFAARAAIAVDLSRRVANDSLRRVVAGQELERQRLARELHDETGQALTSILLGLKAVEDSRTQEEMTRATAGLRELVVATLQDVRRLAVELRPKALDDFGLLAAVERLVDTFSEATGINVELESRLGANRLPAEVETTLYRIIQESLTNVVKHAEARSVSIFIVRRDSTATVVIEDDGRGFDDGEIRDGGLGVLGMRERVALLNGRLTFESSETGGTTVAAEVPLP